MNWSLFFNSICVAGASTLLALLLGLVVAVVLSVSFPLMRRTLLVLTIAVLALPSFLVTNCWIDLLGTNGLLHRWLPLNIFSLGGSIWILALLLWPIPALTIWSAWQKLEVVHFEIDSALCGVNLFRHLLFPAARSSIAGSAAIVFALALNNFAVPSILQIKVFPSEIWVKFNTNLDAVAALQVSWPLLLAPALLLVLLRRTETSWPRDAAADTAPALRRSLGITELCCAAILAVLTWLLALIVPVAQLAATPRTWSEFLPALTAGTNAMTNSFVYAAVASIFSAAIAIVLARTTKLGWLWFFFFVPGIMLGIGASAGFSRPGLDFFSRTIAIVIALLIVRYIAIARSITRNAILSIDRELIDAGRLDGARGWKLFWHVGFPQVAGEIAVAAYFVYLLCLWDVETILFVIPPGGETLALRIFNLLHYGHNAHVNALCMLLLLLAIAPLLAWQLFQLVRKAISKTALGMIFAVAIGATGCSQRKQSDSVSFPIRSSIFSSVEIIGSRGTGAGQFNKPRSLALDTNDNLFVVDMTGRVQKFSPDGKFVLSWQMPETDLGKPKGMCRDRDGNIVILEPHYQRVNHFTPDGKLVSQWGVKGTNAGELTLPRAVAVDTKNNVIVPEYTLVDRVQKFSAYGKRCLVTWGTPGLAPGQFNRAEGVDVDSADRIYIADSCNHRIQIFSGNGKFLRTYGKAGKGIGEMNYPSDIRVDEQGRQYVCEFGGNRIQVFDSNDRPLESIGKAGDAPGEFHEPWSIAFDSKGNLYVADALNHRVQKFLRRK